MKSPDPFWLGPIGIDVAKWQGKVNWNAVRESGYSFAFVKASEGVGYEDPTFKRNWNEARAAGLLVGAYHFARVSKSPTIEDDAMKEAEWFASRLGSNTANMLPPVLDIEWDKNADKVIPSKDLITWCEVFTQTLGSLTQRTPAMYTGFNFMRFRMQHTTRFSHLPLWQVHYTNATAPKKMPSWPRWTFWQWSYTQPLPGSSSTKVDANRFNGSADDLVKLANKVVEIGTATSGSTTVVEKVPQVEETEAPWWEKLLEITNSVTRAISENARRGG